MTVLWLRLLAAAGAVLLAACNDGIESAAPGRDALSFIVVGDAPYGPEDEAMLADALPLIKASRTPFVVHLGDYKGGKTACADHYDAAFAALIDDLRPTPVFYTPGDNEWTDCDRNPDQRTGRPYSDLDRLDKIRTLFFSGPPAALDEPGAAEAFGFRQQETLIENATWIHERVRFLTVHVVGTNNGRNWVVGDSLLRAREAVEARDAANLEWITAGFKAARQERARAVIIAMQGDPVQIWRQARGKPCDADGTQPVRADGEQVCDGFLALRRRLREEALAFDGPVLVMHGDTAPFSLNQDFLGETAPNLWRFNAAGDAGVGRTGLPYGLRDVAMVTFDPSKNKPFSAFGLLTGETPKEN